MKYITSLLLLFSMCLNLSAQDKILVNGEISDAFLKTPMPDARVTILTEDSIIVMDSITIGSVKDRNGKIVHTQFNVMLPRGKSYIVRGRQDGYEDAYANVDLHVEGDGIFSIDNGLQLRKIREVFLGEVEVKATKIKMFYKGDTLVYNANAFNLPNGSMLNDLIRQMPGVTMNDKGEIFVNGRKVDELLLGERSFFRGNSKVLLKNLPYYTVKNVKVYEHDSDINKAMGQQITQKQYVMDVNLKNEYKQGLISNVEAAAGTEKRYLGRIFTLAFSDPFRITLLGNLNNVSESRYIGENGHWRPESMPKSLLTTRSAAAEIDWQAPNGSMKDLLNVSFTSTKDENKMRQQKETFLDGISPINRTHSQMTNNAKRLTINNKYTLIKPTFLTVATDFNYRTYSGFSEEASEFFNDTLTHRLFSNGIHEGHDLDVSGNLSGFIKVGSKKKGFLNYKLDYKHTYDSREQATKYDVRQAVDIKQQRNARDVYHSNNSMSALLSYRHSLKNQFLVVQNYAGYGHEKAHDFLYHPDTLMLPSQLDMLSKLTDANNSYKSQYIKAFNTLTLEWSRMQKLMPDDTMPFALDYSPYSFSVDVTAQNHSLDYQRGTVDTTATITSMRIAPRFSSTLYPTGKYNCELKFSVSHEYDGAVSLFDRINYRDDSQPLIVKLGNTALKGNQTSHISVDFNSRGSHQRLLHIAALFDYRHRETAQSVRYQACTGIYTYRPMNVSGGYNLTGKIDFTRALDANRYWTLQTNGNANLYHSIDHTLLNGEDESHENVVNTWILHNNTYIQYNKGALNLRVLGDIRWRRSTGRLVDFTVLSAFDYQYGLNSRYTIPGINTTVSVDANVYSRRGYGNSMLNTDDVVVNASLSQPFIKGKLVARVEVFDLLHQLSNTQYEVNAQGRTETWYHSLPHYVMLHLVYSFNKSPKRK